MPLVDAVIRTTLSFSLIRKLLYGFCFLGSISTMAMPMATQNISVIVRVSIELIAADAGAIPVSIKCVI
jgi:hypothetical protein